MSRKRTTSPTVTDAPPGELPVTEPVTEPEPVASTAAVTDPTVAPSLVAGALVAEPPSFAELLAAHRGVEPELVVAEPAPAPEVPEVVPSFEELRDARLAAAVPPPAPARATFTLEVVEALNQIPKLTSLRDVEAWVEANPDAASVCGFLPSFTRFPPDSMPSPDVMVCCDDEVMVLFTRRPEGGFSKKRLSR